MTAVGERKCIRAMDAATRQDVEICEDRPLSEALPTPAAAYVDPKDFQYGAYCKLIDQAKGDNVLNYVRKFYETFFDLAAWTSDHSVGGAYDKILASTIGETEDPAEKKNRLHWKWWTAYGGFANFIAARNQLKRVKTVEEAVALLKKQKEIALAAGDTVNAQIIDDLLTRPSEILRKELERLRDSARTTGASDLAADLDDALLQQKIIRGKKPSDPNNVLGNATIKQNRMLRPIRRAIVKEAQAVLTDPAIPIEAKLALQRVLGSSGSGNTWNVLNKEFKSLLQGSPEAAAVVKKEVLAKVRASQARQVRFIETLGSATSSAETKLFNAFRMPLPIPPAPAAGVALPDITAIDGARRNLLPPIFRTNLVGNNDGLPFWAKQGAKPEYKAAQKMARAAEKEIVAAVSIGDAAKAEAAMLRRDQYKITEGFLRDVLKSPRSKTAAGMMDEIAQARIKAESLEELGVPTVKALDRVAKAGQQTFSNALGKGGGSPMNLIADIAAASPAKMKWIRFREATYGTYESGLLIKAWWSAYLNFTQLIQGPDEVVDMIGGKDLRGASRELAYDAVAGLGLYGSVQLVHHEYTQLQAGGGRVVGRTALALALAWFFSYLFWEIEVDQREGRRLDGKNPEFGFDRKYFNPNRPISAIWNLAAISPLIALGSKFSLKFSEVISASLGWQIKSKLGATALEQVSVATDAEVAAIETGGLGKVPALAKQFGRGIPIAFGTWPRNRAFIVNYFTQLMSSVLLGYTVVYGRALTQGKATHGGSIRPVFTSFGTQVVGSGLTVMGANLSVYAYLFASGPATQTLFTWDYCNTLETSSYQLARAQVEWYRQSTSGTVEEAQSADQFQHYFHTCDGSEQQDLIKNYGHFPELFHGMVSAPAMPEELVVNPDFSEDPVIGHLIPKTTKG